MSNSILDPAELSALQGALNEAMATVRGRPATMDTDVTPLALIADDRDAASAKPLAQAVGDGWARVVQQILRNQLRSQVDVNVASVDVVDGRVLRDELSAMWLCSVRISERPGVALVAIGGAFVPLVAAMACGATKPTPSDRPPSATSLRIFDPVGRSLAQALRTMWSETQHGTLTTEHTTAAIDAAKRAVTETDVVLSINLRIEGATTGSIRLVAKPATLVPAPATMESVPATSDALQTVLGAIPIEVRVELGRAQVTLRELRTLTVGTVFAFNHFVDDLLPISCNGMVKALGRPVSTRGVMAIQIEHVLNQKDKGDA